MRGPYISASRFVGADSISARGGVKTPPYKAYNNFAQIANKIAARGACIPWAAVVFKSLYTL